MSIYLNGIKIPGFNQKVSGNLTLKSVDISGKTSYTPRAETGDKGKTISVATVIRCVDEKQLKQLINLAQKKNVALERMIYNIVNTTANAMGIKQVKFDGDVQVREDQNLQQWSVTFELLEYNSVAEIVEQREASKGVTEQTATGVSAGSGSPTTQTEQTIDLTAFEKVLKSINTVLQ